MNESAMTKGIRPAASLRNIITRVTLFCYLLLLIWRGYSHLLPVQLEDPALNKENYDLVFLLYKFSGLQQLVVNNDTGSLLFTVMLFLFCALAILFPSRRGVIIPFSILFFIMGIIFPVNLSFAAHYMGGIMLLHFVFWPKKDRDFELLWDGMRYYTCWVYASAFLWKIINGALFQPDFGSVAFRNNLSSYLFHNPETILAHFYYFLLQHPFILDFGDKIIFFLEGFFLVGFFTKRFDRLLLVFTIVIHLATYYFIDTLFIELCVISITLIPLSSWNKLAGRFPLLNRSYRSRGRNDLSQVEAL